MDRIYVDKNKGIVELNLRSHDVGFFGDIAVRHKSDGYCPATVPSDPTKAKSPLARALAAIAITSLVGAVIFAVWYWNASGNVPDFVSISAKAFSVTLIGSLLSLGGVNILSLKGDINSLQQAVHKFADCPFLPLSNAPFGHKYSPGNPNVCAKCPLGIEIASNTDGGLINNCKAYGQVHRAWKEERANLAAVTQPGSQPDLR